MSRIDDLIAEHCPDGVEFRALREIADFRRGSAMTVRSAVPGPYPLVANGPKPIATHHESNRDGEFVVVARSGAYAGTVSRWSGPLFLTDAFSVHPHPEKMTTGFAYYLLQSQQDVLRGMKAGGGVPHVRVKEIEELKVPVPPAAVQREIAAILDKMETLKAELEAELEYRSRQYAYYRDSLLTFAERERESGGQS